MFVYVINPFAQDYIQTTIYLVNILITIHLTKSEHLFTASPAFLVKLYLHTTEAMYICQLSTFNH